MKEDDMSSMIYPFQNRQMITEMASHFAVGASLIMVVYVLTEGWLW
jgi:hypothetical protein